MPGIIVAVFMSLFVVGMPRGWWGDYWLLRDGQPNRGIVTRLVGRRSVEYRYTVNEKEYWGRCPRNSRDPKYSRVGPGEETVIYYSVSRPWISCVNKPTDVGVGLPVWLLALVFEILGIVTILNPASRWALRTGIRRVKSR